MTTQQVTDILGNPDGQVTHGGLVVFAYVDRWISGWSNLTADYLLVFDQGRLASWGTTTIRQPDNALAAMALQYDRNNAIRSLGN